MISEAYLYICRSRERAVQSTESEFENWKVSHAHAMAARDVEDWIRECLRAAENTLEGHRSILDKLRSNSLKADPQAVGETLSGLLRATVSLMNSIRELVDQMESAGYEIDNAVQFRTSHTQLGAVKDSFERTWPWRNPEIWRRTEAQIASGECQFTEGILHDLQSGHTERD